MSMCFKFDLESYFVSSDVHLAKIKIWTICTMISMRPIKILITLVGWILLCNLSPALEVLKFIISLCSGRGQSIFRCPRPRRKPSRRCASWDDRPKCDRMHRRVTDCDIWRPQLEISYALWPEAKCLPIFGACFYYRRAPEETKDQVPTICFLFRSIKWFKGQSRVFVLFSLFLFVICCFYLPSVCCILELPLKLNGKTESRK